MSAHVRGPEHVTVHPSACRTKGEDGGRAVGQGAYSHSALASYSIPSSRLPGTVPLAVGVPVVGISFSKC